MPYPRHIRTTNLIGEPEWLVRGFDINSINAAGELEPTPEHLLKRYYRAHHVPDIAYSSLRGATYINYEDILKVSGYIEYDTNSFNKIP